MCFLLSACCRFGNPRRRSHGPPPHCHSDYAIGSNVTPSVDLPLT
jgi:hypothetical protein